MDPLLMQMPTILVATWENGLVRVTGNTIVQEIPAESVRSLAGGTHGEVFAIVGRHSLRRRSPAGQWTEIAQSEFELSCCVPVGDAVFVGTDDARILRVDSDGTQQCLRGLDAVAGRDTWYAATAIVDGKPMGPPLGIRSMSATCDGVALLANVHVGGIPRSTDSGVSWQPTIDIESDIHQVCAHPARPGIVIAAAATGLCVSRDAGATWTTQRHGLHDPYCSAVACGKDNFFVAASTGPFAAQSAVYRRSIDGNGPLQPLGAGMPTWTDGIVDTNCIATRDAIAAAIDSSGRLYFSHDDGDSWSQSSQRFPAPSALYIC